MTAISQGQRPRPRIYQPAEVVALFHSLCDAFHKGRFTLAEFSDALDALRVIDMDGAVWTIGARSGKWYRQDGDRWIQSEPSGDLVMLIELISYDRSKRAGEFGTCHQCGAKSATSSPFCRNCGAELAASRSGPARPVGEVYCRQCGHRIKESARFCSNCGAGR